MKEPQIMVCKEDQIEVEPTAKEKRLIGKGERIFTWKHKSLYDEGGNPYCGNGLTDSDVEPLSEA